VSPPGLNERQRAAIDRLRSHTPDDGGHPSPPPPTDEPEGPARTDPATATRPDPPAWPTLHEDALHGLPGHVVATLDPHTEADPVSVLLSFLIAFGSATNAGPHATADGSAHPARLYGVLVGETSRARKGTSWSNVRKVMAYADAVWMTERTLGGLASGEGLIAAVRDHDDEEDADRTTTVDKRLMVVEPEFARVLSVADRQGNTLSAVIRQAWDDGALDVTTRKDPLRARDAHVSILGHVTLDELRRRLVDGEVANGFANRFLLCCVRRSKLLPTGGNLTPELLSGLGKLTADALRDARQIGTMRRDAATEARWAVLYQRMHDEAPSGLVGAVTARAEAQVLRLSVAYALTDASATIRIEHLNAAWALWSYCEASAAYIFGDSLGDEVADRLLAALRVAGTDGLNGTEQRDLFGRHASGERIKAARTLLEERDLARSKTVPTDGRPVTVTYAT
jgi:hypothetical protein